MRTTRRIGIGHGEEVRLRVKAMSGGTQADTWV